MNILLKSLTLVNFKGIKSFSTDFSEETRIFGSNATGKTTLFDAFMFLLFGKDSADRKDFNIRPLDAAGKQIDYIDCEVSGTLDASGVIMNLKRVSKQKWTKKRGSETADFEGNETLYYWNDVPLQQKEYISKIETILNEGVFKLITNPLYFNSLKWQDRRQVLLAIAGEIDINEVLDSITTMQNKSEVFNLTNILSQGKTMAEYKKEIDAKKKKAKDDLKMIPSRIDEAEKSKPEAVNFDATRSSIKRLNGELLAIDEKISDKAKVNEDALKLIQEKQKTVYSLKSEQTSIEYRIREEIKDRNRKSDEHPNRLKREIASFDNDLIRLVREKTALVTLNESLNAKLQPLRDEIKAEGEKELKFDEGSFVCPTCKRVHEEEDIEAQKEQMKKNFNTQKVNKVDSIRDRGLSIKASIEANQSSIDALIVDIKELEEKKEAAQAELRKLTSVDTVKLTESEELDQQLKANNEYLELNIRINDLQSDIEKSKENQVQPDDSDLKAKKSELSQSIAELNKQLAGEDQIKRTNERIEQLKEQERSLAQLIAEYDGSEFVIEAFTKAKMNIMESRINSKFQLARFKMFDIQINGSEVETCDTTYNGVPWSDLNTAAKIQVGIDIINALSEFYKVNAPIWIDNRESTVRIPATESQVINLVVSEFDSVLRVENKKLELVNA